MIKSTFAFSIILIFIFQSIHLSAQESETDSLMHEKIQCIENMLNQSKNGVNGWWYGWLAGYSAATIAQGTVYFLSDDLATKQDMALGSVTTLLGAGLQILTPLNTGIEAKRLSDIPETNNEELTEKLRIAEEMLESNAMKEKAGRSWQVHALNEAVNLGSGLITWLGFERNIWDGVSNFLINSVVTEAQIWTQPTRTMKDYQQYRQKYMSGSNTLVSQFQPEYFLSTYPGGVSLRIVF